MPRYSVAKAAFTYTVLSGSKFCLAVKVQLLGGVTVSYISVYVPNLNTVLCSRFQLQSGNAISSTTAISNCSCNWKVCEAAVRMINVKQSKSGSVDPYNTNK